VSFDADFLETWLSPVEYARKFKAMHGMRGADKNIFYHVGPYLGLTGANGDAAQQSERDRQYPVTCA